MCVREREERFSKKEAIVGSTVHPHCAAHCARTKWTTLAANKLASEKKRHGLLCLGLRLVYIERKLDTGGWRCSYIYGAVHLLEPRF